MHKIVITLARTSVVALVAATIFAAELVVLVRSQGQLILSVQTGSMSPAIRPGDAVFVQQRPKQMNVGDIISYRSQQNPDVIITHRVVAIDRVRGRITTKGDALDTADPAFSSDRVVGLVVHTIPLAGYGFSFVRHPLGLAVVVYTPAIILILSEIRRLMRHYAHQRYVLYYY